jgi:hypothetical protein
MVQVVDPETAVRVDVFRVSAGTLERATSVVSAADLLAHLARLLLDLAAGRTVPRKHADDYRRLLDRVSTEAAEIAWRDHRKPAHPATFREACGLIPERSDLLIAPQYSQDATALCPRCVASTVFRLADPEVILALLGYC